MATKLFAVIRTQSTAWNAAFPVKDQNEWDAHVSFMDDLAAEGFVLLAGPLEDTPDALLIVRADNRDEITDRLRGDPWMKLDIVRVKMISLWGIRLGSLQ
jgi:hypothetical protein